MAKPIRLINCANSKEPNPNKMIVINLLIESDSIESACAIEGTK